MELVPLSWDSTFFGFSIARVDGRGRTPQSCRG